MQCNVMQRKKLGMSGYFLSSLAHAGLCYIRLMFIYMTNGKDSVRPVLVQVEMLQKWDNTLKFGAVCPLITLQTKPTSSH